MNHDIAALEAQIAFAASFFYNGTRYAIPLVVTNAGLVNSDEAVEHLATVFSSSFEDDAACTDASHDDCEKHSEERSIVDDIDRLASIAEKTITLFEALRRNGGASPPSSKLEAQE